MKLLFKQRLFSWFDSYDIYREDGSTAYTVKGRLSWGHRLEIYDPYNQHIGTVQEKVFSFLPKFEIYHRGDYLGEIRKEFTFFKPVFQLECNGWRVEGDYLQWNYQVVDRRGGLIMSAEKELLRMTDTYVMDIVNEEDSLLCLMIVLAIDAAKCSDSKN